MKKPQKSSHDPKVSDHKRRDFLSLSSLAAATFLMSMEGRGSALAAESNDATIRNEVSAGDSLALYTNLLDEVRRLVLQRDAKMIFVAKMEATDWLQDVTSRAQRLTSSFAAGTTPTATQLGDLRSFLTEVESGGREIFQGLVRMRQQPLDEIRRLDMEFDSIRADLTSASNAIKSNNPTVAKIGITAAVNKLKKYSTPEIEVVSKTFEQEYRINLITPARLQQLFQTVHDSLGGAAPGRTEDLNHARLATTRMSPDLKSGITEVLKTKLKPSSLLQRGIGYAVALPILLGVSDKDKRVKLLNDALRLVPPGLRNPLLAELATELANLN